MSKQYDYLIVGAGLCGAVFAREAVKAGKPISGMVVPAVEEYILEHKLYR